MAITMLEFRRIIIVFPLVLLAFCKRPSKPTTQSTQTPTSPKLEVTDFSPEGISVPVWSEVWIQFSSQVTFSFEITPQVEGQIKYDSPTSRLIFSPAYSLEYDTEYFIKIRATDIYSGNVTQFSWSFKTQKKDTKTPWVVVSSCFKDKIYVEINPVYPASILIFVNSTLAEKLITYSTFPIGFEIEDGVKDGENVVEVVLDYSFSSFDLRNENGLILKFKDIAERDTLPPAPPVLKGQKIKFTAETYDIGCAGLTGEYLLYHIKDGDELFLGSVANEFTTLPIVFEGGEICVKAVDSVGNISECSNKIKQGYKSTEFSIGTTHNILPIWGKVFFIDSDRLLFNDGSTIQSADINCNRIVPMLDYILCEWEGNVFILDRDIRKERLNSSKILSSCPNANVFSDGTSVISKDWSIGLTGVDNLDCSDNFIIGFSSSDKNLHLIDVASSAVFSNHLSTVYLGIFINPDITVEGIFAEKSSFAVFIKNFDPYHFLSQITDTTGIERTTLPRMSLLYWLSSMPAEIFNALYVKEYPLNEEILKVTMFDGILVALVKDGKLMVDANTFSPGGEEFLYDNVVDIGLSNFTGDRSKDLFIVFRDGKVKIFHD